MLTTIKDFRNKCHKNIIEIACLILNNIKILKNYIHCNNLICRTINCQLIVFSLDLSNRYC